MTSEVKFCKHARKNFASRLRRARIELRIERAKKQRDEVKRATEREMQQSSNPISSQL